MCLDGFSLDMMLTNEVCLLVIAQSEPFIFRTLDSSLMASWIYSSAAETEANFFVFVFFISHIFSVKMTVSLVY